MNKKRPTPLTRFDWRPTPEQWIEIGKSYCPRFHAAMLAVAADGADRELSHIERDGSVRHVLDEMIDGALRRVEDARVAFDESRVVPGCEDMGARWTLRRREADLAYEEAERDRLLDKKPHLTKASQNCNREFASLSRNHRLPGDLSALANIGRQWQAEIRDMARWRAERTTEMQALHYRQKIAEAARALMRVLVDAPDELIYPPARAFAMSDIKRRLASIDEAALESSIDAIRRFSQAAHEAAADFAHEIDGQFIGGSPWGAWIIDVKGWARGHELPDEIGASDGSAPFAKFLIAVEHTMPMNFRRRIAPSTLVSRAHGAVRAADKARRDSKGSKLSG